MSHSRIVENSIFTPLTTILVKHKPDQMSIVYNCNLKKSEQWTLVKLGLQLYP